MKAKVSVRVCMPNVNRFRGRVENPSKDLTKQLRDALTEVICDVVNGNQITVRAKFIERVNALGLTYKSEAHKAKVLSVVETFFDTIAAPTEEALAALIGGDEVDESDTLEESESPDTDGPDETPNTPNDEFEE